MFRISVIIPVFNTEKYLRKCLDSVCNQTLKDIEIICVNDCSTDNSLSILQEYGDRDNRVKIINFERNKGVSAARNAGIDAALGEYIGFVDSDDFVDLDFYEKLYDKTGDGIDIVKGRIRSYGDDNPYRDFFVNYVDDNNLIATNKGYFIFCFSSCLFSFKLIRLNHIHFCENLIFSEDVCFAIDVVVHSKQLRTCNDAFYYYVVSKTSVIRNKKSKYVYLRSHVFATDHIIHSIQSEVCSHSEYVAIFCMVLYWVYSSVQYIGSGKNYPEFSENWMEYVLSKCKYPTEVEKLFYGHMRKLDLILNKKRFQWLRERLKKNTKKNNIIEQ